MKNEADRRIILNSFYQGGGYFFTEGTRIFKFRPHISLISELHQLTCKSMFAQEFNFIDLLIKRNL